MHLKAIISAMVLTYVSFSLHLTFRTIIVQNNCAYNQVPERANPFQYRSCFEAAQNLIVFSN